MAEISRVYTLEVRTFFRLCIAT